MIVLQDDEGWLVGLGLGRLDRGVQLGDVLDVLAGLLPVDDLGLPAIGLVAAATSSVKATFVSSSIEIWLES